MVVNLNMITVFLHGKMLANLFLHLLCGMSAME